MRDPLQALDELAAVARRERAPEVDVSWRVGVRIAGLKVRPRDRTLIWVAAFSAVTATIAMLMAAPVFDTLSDPVAVMIQAMNTIN